MTIQKLNKILGILILLLTLSSCSSKILIPGRYGTNFPTYGMFGKSITLNCDSSVVMNFAGDLMNDNSFGKWTTIYDTLLIVFDTINYPNSRYKDSQYYLIRGRKLFNIPLTTSQYNELLNTLNETKSDSVRSISYKRLNRKIDKTMTNHKGTMRRQHFVRSEQIECNE